MDFFEHQDQARRSTRLLTLLFIAATLGIVAATSVVVAFAAAGMDSSYAQSGLTPQQWARENALLFVWSALGTIAFIGSASLYRVASLRGGGATVARELGGSLVESGSKDPLLRRLYNVVEEMAIASGVPVPEVYVLAQESGINAFAAGFNTSDAAVAVTRGTLEQLDRKELQGVIAHEFSHILNGDMRLNIRLMGIIFGIVAIGTVGRIILYSGSHRGVTRSNRNGGGAGLILVAGLGLFLIGYIGVFFGQWIRSAVSRQREFLADASAVQFTRETDGIAGALKKIGGYEQHSYVDSPKSDEIGHMLFALGRRSFASMFATHPPLDQRIKALDPNFDPAQYQAQVAAVEGGPASESADTPVVGLSGLSDGAEMSIDAATVIASAADPNSAQLLYAGQIRGSIPARLLEVAHSFSESSALVIALLLDRDESVRQRQLVIVEQQMGKAFFGLAKTLFDQVEGLSPVYRLPLLDITFPAIKRRPSGHREFIYKLVEQLIAVDGRIDLFEYALAKVFFSHIRDLDRVSRDIRQQGLDSEPTRVALQTVLSMLAKFGHRSESEAAAAYAAGWTKLPVQDAEAPPSYAPPTRWIVEMNRALDHLDGLAGDAKRLVIAALTTTIGHDQRVTLREAELLRAICAGLHVPVPPIVAGVS